VLSVDNGNDFIKKVLDSDSKIITDIIHKDYGVSIKISIEVAKNDNALKKNINKEENPIEEDHPLLDDAIKIFKGKMIS